MTKTLLVDRELLERVADLLEDLAPIQSAESYAVDDLRALLSQLEQDGWDEVVIDDDAFAEEFSAWWGSEGQYVRSGGGDYERTVAFQAWRHLMPKIAQHDRIASGLRAEVERLTQQRDKLAGLLPIVSADLKEAMNWGDLDRIATKIDAALAEVKP